MAGSGSESEPEMVGMHGAAKAASVAVPAVVSFQSHAITIFCSVNDHHHCLPFGFII